MDYFSKLELDYLSKSDREDIENYWRSAVITSEHEFVQYLTYRLSNNIPLRQFENIAQNIFNFGLGFIKREFVEFMATAYLKNNFHNYFQHLVKFDKKRFAVESLYSPDLDIILSIVGRLIHHVSHNYRLEETLQYLRNLSKDTSIKYHLLLCYLGEKYYERGDKVRVLFMIDSLEIIDKYDLLSVSLFRKSVVWDEIGNSLSDDKFFEYTKERLHDNDLLCKAIRNEANTHFFWSGKHLLLRAMLESPQNIPQTLEHILQHAISVSQFDIVIQLGSCFPKKRILEIIAAQKNPDLLDKFFFLYKNYPEVKKLAPFI